jgi:tetraacyldisaccharide 4'-kinase
LEFLQGKKIAALSGIAAPRGFEETLERLGGELVYRKRFADHHRYRPQEILDVLNAARDRGADLVLTTEKDAVRLPLVDRRDLPILYLRVQIELLSGAEDFDALISRICFK